MSNLKTKDKIIKLGDRYGLSPSAMLLLKSMLIDSDSGSIHGYRSYENKYVDLFPSGLNEYYAAFLELLNGKFIDYAKDEDYVFIRPFINTNFYSILGAIEGHKRQYQITSETEYNEKKAFSYNEGALVEPYITDINDDQLIRYNTKTNGVKIPESLHPFFTGEKLTTKEIEVLSQLDSNYLARVKDRRNLTKEEKRVYYACMKFSDSNGILEDYNERSLINSIIIEFGDGSVCQSTVYLAIKKLLTLGLIRIDVNDRTGYYLVVVGYKEAFERKERYVIIPDVVLEKAFKKCQASTIKAFFKILFMLNNGDGGEGSNTGHNKSVRLSFEKYLPKKYKQEQIHDYEDWLKKRYPGEVSAIVWGDIDAAEINSLACFFHINYDNNDGHLSYYFRIRNKFYISKKADLFKTSLALSGKDMRRAQSIEEAFNKYGLYCSQEDLRDLVKIFRGAGRKNINFIIGQLADRVRLVNDSGLPEIRSIPAYVFTLYRSIKGEPEAPDDPPDL